MYIQTMLKQPTKNIQAMKATMKSKIVQVTLASLFLLTAVAFTPAQAAAPNSKEVQDAVARLEAYNLAAEKSISFFVPVLTETVEDYLEFEAAEIRLEYKVSALESEIRYVSPAVSENFDDYEVMEAMENLDKVTGQVEKTIVYKAPSAAE